jgi:cytochrome c553
LKELSLLFALVISPSIFAQDAARGKELYATCIQCHGDKGLGDPAQEAPRIAGQHEWYILSSLKMFVSGERKNPKMLPFIKNLNEKDFQDLARYISAME